MARENGSVWCCKGSDLSVRLKNLGLFGRGGYWWQQVLSGSNLSGSNLKWFMQVSQAHAGGSSLKGESGLKWEGVKGVPLKCPVKLGR